MTASIHATVVTFDGCGILIRGPSGAGKSRLAFELMSFGSSNPAAPRCRLVADDRVMLVRSGGAIVASPAPELRGLIEIRGLGIRRCDFEPQATIGLVVDLAAGDAARMPAPDALSISLDGVILPRIPVEKGFSGLALVLAALTTHPFEEGMVGKSPRKFSV
jgi:serine kinase of HPr protein (carbohydrate metabolism regulator)